MALVLTAMKVGLGTNSLKDNPVFRSVSYGFTIFSILALLVVLGVVLILILALAIFNIMHMVSWTRGTEARLGRCCSHALYSLREGTSREVGDII
jgi:hypothetical protein